MEGGTDRDTSGRHRRRLGVDAEPADGEERGLYRLSLKPVLVLNTRSASVFPGRAGTCQLLSTVCEISVVSALEGQSAVYILVACRCRFCVL